MFQVDIFSGAFTCAARVVCSDDDSVFWVRLQSDYAKGFVACVYDFWKYGAMRSPIYGIGFYIVAAVGFGCVPHYS